MLSFFISETCSVVETRNGEFKPCIFPFKYSGQTFDSCTTIRDPDKKPWCSTKVDADGNHVTAGGYWGHCGQDCDDENFDSQRPELSAFEGRKQHLPSSLLIGDGMGISFWSLCTPGKLSFKLNEKNAINTGQITLVQFKLFL